MIALHIAFVAWIVQQVNDFINAYRNRSVTPRLFWLSAGASLVSGTALFLFIYGFVYGVINVIGEILGVLRSVGAPI